MPDGYGYEKDGVRVSALQDMFDGGGAGTSGDFFKGGGGISALANALKIRPYGSTAPRADIGYRNVADMFDGGGPQRSGGEFVGLPHSQFLNIFGMRPRRAAPVAVPTAAPVAAPAAVPTAAPTAVPTHSGLGNTDVNVGGTGAPLVADTGGTPVSAPPAIQITPLTDFGTPMSFRSGAPDVDNRVNQPVTPMSFRQPTDTPASSIPDSWFSAVHMPMNTEHYDMMARRFGNLSRTFSPNTIMKVGRSHYNTGGF